MSHTKLFPVITGTGRIQIVKMELMPPYKNFRSLVDLITPYAQRELGKVIERGVHIYNIAYYTSKSGIWLVIS